mgnify:CR=1 FL=1
MPLPLSTNESEDRLDAPLAASRPPVVTIELAQPAALLPLLPHGHAAPDPSPKQNGVEE